MLHALMSETTATRPLPSMETLVTLCKRRGFIFQSSEIYGGYAGFFDYGPLGVELKRNVKNAWWKAMVHARDDIVGLDSSIIMHPEIWRASGHVEGFNDPMVDCRESKRRFRADQLFFAPVRVAGETIGYVSVEEAGDMQAQAEEQARELKRKLARQGELEPVVLRDYTEAKPEEYALIPSPATGKPGTLTAPRQFNLMFETRVGPLADASSVAYLRPETAQGIFQNYRNVVDTGRVKIPFGIAQIGKAFRNEITPGNFIFRDREFEQMEIEFFCKPGTDEEWHKHWVDFRLNWYKNNLGIRPENLRVREIEKSELAHYAKATFEVEYLFPMGWSELEGIANRTDYDLKRHGEFSLKDMTYFDEETNEHITPYVIEPSEGVDRTVLVTLLDAYHEEQVRNEKRVVLKLHKSLAPIKAAVLPLLRNRPEIVSLAHDITNTLRKHMRAVYDDTASIGRLYRRQDEIGTLYCVTVDVQSLEDNMVTIRDRDTMEQVRVPVAELKDVLVARLAA